MMRCLHPFGKNHILNSCEIPQGNIGLCGLKLVLFIHLPHFQIKITDELGQIELDKIQTQFPAS